MSKSSGLGARLYFGGVDVSGDTASLEDISTSRATFAKPGIDVLAQERIHATRDGKMDVTSWFNPARAHLKYNDLPTADVVLTYCHRATLGSSAAALVAKQVSYDGTRSDDGDLTFKLSALANKYGLEWGVLLTDAARSDTTATNGASLDGAASSTFGLQAYLQVLSFTGTSCTVKIQDSADNSSWLDLTAGSFGAQTAAGASRIATAANATVRRYLRVATTGTFSQCSFVVSVVRNTETPVF